MLVQEGADPHIKNKNGESPLQKCPPDLATVVKTFAQKHGFVEALSLLVHLNWYCYYVNFLIVNITEF